MNTKVEVRPEILKKFRIVSNGWWFRVQRLRRIWLLGPTWCTVHGDGSWTPHTDMPSEAKAREALKDYALQAQREHDAAQHGWQPI